MFSECYTAQRVSWHPELMWTCGKGTYSVLYIFLLSVHSFEGGRAIKIFTQRVQCMKNWKLGGEKKKVMFEWLLVQIRTCCSGGKQKLGMWRELAQINPGRKWIALANDRLLMLKLNTACSEECKRRFFNLICLNVVVYLPPTFKLVRFCILYIYIYFIATQERDQPKLAPPFLPASTHHKSLAKIPTAVEEKED